MVVTCIIVCNQKNLIPPITKWSYLVLSSYTLFVLPPMWNRYHQLLYYEMSLFFWRTNSIILGISYSRRCNLKFQCPFQELHCGLWCMAIEAYCNFWQQFLWYGVATYAQICNLSGVHYTSVCKPIIMYFGRKTSMFGAVKQDVNYYQDFRVLYSLKCLL